MAETINYQPKPLFQIFTKGYEKSYHPITSGETNQVYTRIKNLTARNWKIINNLITFLNYKQFHLVLRMLAKNWNTWKTYMQAMLLHNFQTDL